MYDPIPQVYPEAAPTLERRPVAWVNWFIVGSTVAVFLLQLLFLHFTGDDVLGNALAFSPDAWAHHRYWTVLTYAWAHATPVASDFWLHWFFWLHIVSNMIPIVCLGPGLEEMLGHLRYLGLYLGGAIAAGTVWYLSTSLAGHSDDPTDGIVGASGAVFAIIAAMGTAVPRAQVLVLFFFVVPFHTSMRFLAIVFGWLPEVAHSAHLGGAGFGFLYTLALRRRLPREKLP
jgi:membrane associated rhomboid family serine protease